LQKFYNVRIHPKTKKNWRTLQKKIWHKSSQRWWITRGAIISKHNVTTDLRQSMQAFSHNKGKAEGIRRTPLIRREMAITHQKNNYRI
jgi:mRNA-degrading endonuclease RelE of RelBE toxin-antitoxin system